MHFVPNRAKITSRQVPKSSNRRKSGFSAPISPLDATFEIGCNASIKSEPHMNDLLPDDNSVPMEEDRPDLVNFRNNLR